MRALVLEHAEGEGAGLVGAALVDGGVALDVARLWRGDGVPDDAAYDLVLALGGPMSAWDDAAHPHLAAEAALLATRARADRPTLGICLGAQLLARGLGAAVTRGPRLEVGLLPIALTTAGRADALLAPLDGARVLHWHHDTFVLPAGAVRLASSQAYANQAFRVGARVWGVQFHPECDRAMRADWAARAVDELRAAGVDATALTSAADAAGGDDDDAIDGRGRALGRALLAQL
jgi:GMP synthase (glutamine-hydrolysing)